MSEIKIETLSPVHIGNGTFLQQGNDYIVEDNHINVLSLDKLGKIIGTDNTTIREWTKAIEEGNGEFFVKEKMQGHSYQEYTKRHIESLIKIDQRQNTLKECIHDGMGYPYIPGSSIKGAIRTAYFSSLAKKTIPSKLNSEENKKKWRNIIAGMEKELLHFQDGSKKSPANDIFKFLHTGDAYYEKGVEKVVEQINLNITKKASLLDNSKPQMVEVIRRGVSSQFRLIIKDDFYQLAKIDSIQDLLKMINDHTYNLLCDEIDFWAKGEGSSYTGQDNYLDQLDIILDKIEECQPNECILRIGQASGWRFVTGAWLEDIDRQYFKNEIVPQCRPKNFLYKSFPFPKSRRIDSSSKVFGFVKLTVL